MRGNTQLITVIVLMIIAIGMAAIVGCDLNTDNTSTDDKQAAQTEQLMSEAQRQIGLPNITNFQQRKLMKLIYELCDKESLVTYAYIKSDYQGKLVFIGKCIGYGIPFSAQYTNPEKVIYRSNNRIASRLTLPQPDPNGLFMPTSSSATWLMMVDPETNEPRPVYIEPEIVVSPFPLTKEKED